MREVGFRPLVWFLWALSVGVLVGETLWAAEEKFPSRPIQIVVAYPPGGAADLHARPLAQVMERLLKQPVVVTNKPGATGTVGYQFVASSKADGYMLTVTMPSFFTIPQVDVLFGRTPSFKLEQFRPVAQLSADPTILVVPASSPWKSVVDLVADAKRRPGDITYGSSGLYSGLHFPMEIFAAVAGVTMRHVPYPGAGPAVTSLLGRHVDAMASGPGPVLSHIKAGTLRALASWGDRRLAILPEVPTLKELGYNAEYYLGVGIIVRKETPPVAMRVLRDAIRQGVRAPEFEVSMTKLGTTVAYLDADDYHAVWEKDARVIAETLKRVGKME